MGHDTKVCDNLSAYQIETEPQSAQRKVLWDLAINLVFENSADFKGYAAFIAHEHILEHIDIDKAQRAIESHYLNKHNTKVQRSYPLDLICVHAVQLLSYKAFTLSPATFVYIHHKLFDSADAKAYNKGTDCHLIHNQSVIKDTAELDYKLCSLIDNEKDFRFDNCSLNDSLCHIALLACDLLSIKAHDFTHRLSTIIFVIQYARVLGFDLVPNFVDKNKSVNTIMHKIQDTKAQTQSQISLHIYTFLADLFLDKGKASC